MSEQDIDFIDRALHGVLNTQEQEAFARRIEVDPEFRKLYEEVQLMANAVKMVAVETRIMTAGQPRSKTISWPTPRTLALAATLLLIAVAGIWLYNVNDKQLLNQYYKVYDGMEIQKPRGSESLYQLKVSALNAYQVRDIPSALSKLDSALLISPDDEESFFLLGLCRLEEKAYDEAVEAFDRLGETYSSQPAVLWYKALAHLGLKDTNNCRRLLTELGAGPPNEFQKDAEELLSRIGAK